MNKATIGVGPAFEDVHIGSDGQLWRWDNGQVVIAASGSAAEEYARRHGWPDHLVSILRQPYPR